MKYAGLHNHSDYSNIKLLDSTISIPTLFDNAYEKGLSAIALTDHDVLSGHVKAVQYYKDNYKDKDFKLILGNEIYLTREGLDSKNYKKGEKFYHTLLLSKNAKGHRQLRKLSSRAWERSFNKYNMMRTPTYPSDLQEIVGEEPGNIIATTACLGSFTGVAFQREGESAKQKIEGYLESMVDIFGYENFYIEVQPSRQRDQTKYNKFMIKNF
jgi:DNA polymerase-3 subunit alpha